MTNFCGYRYLQFENPGHQYYYQWSVSSEAPSILGGAEQKTGAKFKLQNKRVVQWVLQKHQQT